MSTASDLDRTIETCRLLADPTRVRLLAVLRIEPLSVAELTQATRLPQPRVSTHLRKLREAGLVDVHRVAGRSCYRRTKPETDLARATLVESVLSTTADPLIAEDARRARAAIAERSRGAWLDGVAGRMERHYSPGRTWEALARTLAGTARVGHVADLGSGDGAVAELLAHFAESIVCVDNNPRIVSAGRERLTHVPHLRFVQADMHALPFADDTFDLVLVLGALQYSPAPTEAVAEAARVLRPGGRMVTSTLRRHVHTAEVQPFGHVNLGYEPEALSRLLEGAGLVVERSAIVAREKRAPHFEVVAATATLPPCPEFP